jgi:hypothetical protein
MSDVLEGAAVPAGAPAVYPLGVSRPPLEVADLPTPEEAFGVARFGRREAFRYAVGPSLFIYFVVEKVTDKPLITF